MHTELSARAWSSCSCVVCVGLCCRLAAGQRGLCGVKALLHKTTSKLFALSALSSSGDQRQQCTSKFWKGHRAQKSQEAVHQCLWIRLAEDRECFLSFLWIGVVLSRRWLLVGLTLIHNINLIHPVDSLSEPATQRSAVITFFSEWVIWTRCSGSGPPQTSLLSLDTFFVSDQLDARFDGFKPSCTCCQHMDTVLRTNASPPPDVHKYNPVWIF